MIVTPSPELLERASRFYIGPHVLIRAACVKIARKLKWMADRARDEEYIEELQGQYIDDGEAEDAEDAG